METVLRRDSDWDLVEGQICKVLEFTPLATVEGGHVKSAGRTKPYAYVSCNAMRFPITLLVSSRTNWISNISGQLPMSVPFGTMKS